MLSSLKILDFSGLLPGPYATMVLADLGADILRVESSSRPDMLRITPPMDGTASAAHRYVNRSKQSIALDLKKNEAIEVVKQLIQKYDIVLEQFRPGVMERLGLGYEVLRDINPRLIYCSLTGFGQTGPYQSRPAHDINYLAISGIASYSGTKLGGPTQIGTQVADLAGGSLHTVIGILAAVIHREKTGLGQAIDVSMTDAAFALNALAGPVYFLGGIEPEPEKLMLNGGTFYDYYQTKDGRYFSVGSLEPSFRKLLCEAIGKPDQIKVAISERPGDVLLFKEIVRTAFLNKTFDEWKHVFSTIDACVEPVLKFSEACTHPQITARNMVVEVPNPEGVQQKQIANPIRFSNYHTEYKYVGREPGANTFEILRDLGFTDYQIEELHEKGVFGS